MIKLILRPLIPLLFGFAFFLSAAETATVRGIVQIQSVEIGPNVLVGLYSAAGNWETRTNEQSKFELDGVPQGDYELEARYPGARMALIQDFRVVSTAPSEVAVNLIVGSCPPCCAWYSEGPGDNSKNPCGGSSTTTYSNSDREGKSSMRGVVSLVCQDNAGLDDATVVITKMGQQKSSTTARTNAAGEFFVPDLEPGRYALRVSRNGYQERNISNERVKYGKIAMPNVQLLENEFPSVTVNACSEVMKKRQAEAGR